MPALKKRERRVAEIPTSSMADIAFLLLIFFLVTTTIDVDTGIIMQLPPPLEDEEPPPIKERNMLAVLLNGQGDILMEGEPASLPMIRETVKKHVTNNGVDPRYAEAPDLAIVSLKTDRQTPYDSYINVLDEMWMAYRELWDAEARALNYPNYEAYLEYVEESGAENVIKDKYTAKISIAEPDEGSGE